MKLKMKISRPPLFIMVNIFILTYLSIDPVLANELNKRKYADSANQAKINRVMAKSRQQEGENIEKNKKNNINRGCQQNVGTVKIEKGQRSPREVTTVIRGDVVNLCRR